MCVYRVCPPTVVMGPPEDILFRRALGLCGLREETVMTQSHCACLQLKYKKNDSGWLPGLFQRTSILLDQNCLLWVDDGGGSHDNSSGLARCRLCKRKTQVFKQGCRYDWQASTKRGSFLRHSVKFWYLLDLWPVMFKLKSDHELQCPRFDSPHFQSSLNCLVSMSTNKNN